jgi:tRNA G18 (ribose-2'-O)-methylase SpoU
MKKEFYLILHNIRSAYNAGAIFRTADGIGISKICLSGYTPTPEDGKKLYQTKSEKMIAKTALGAEMYISWEKNKNVSSLLAKLRNNKFQIVALEQNKRSIDYRKFKPKFPIALVIGNEPRGINKKILDKCDAIIEIPMQGRKESLNVAVAVGVAGYEIKSKM